MLSGGTELSCGYEQLHKWTYQQDETETERNSSGGRAPCAHDQRPGSSVKTQASRVEPCIPQTLREENTQLIPRK